MRLDSFRAALPEEPEIEYSEPMETQHARQLSIEKGNPFPTTSWNAVNYETPYPHTTEGAQWNNTSFRPLMSNEVERPTISRPPSGERARKASQDNIIVVTPKKLAALHQHRQNDSKRDSKIEAERPSTAKRKKTM